MPLSLGVKKGSKVTVGDAMVEVREIVSLSEIHVSVNNGPAVVITNAERTEILPGVFLQAGRDEGAGHSTKSYTRLAFDAPRSIPINRVRPA